MIFVPQMTEKMITSISITPEIYHKSRVYMAQKQYRSFSKLVEVALQKIMTDNISE